MVVKTAKAATVSSYDDDYNYGTPEQPKGPPVAGLEVVKVVREYVPLHGGGSRTFGEMVDEYLLTCAEAGSEVQQVNLQFTNEQWFAAAQTLRGKKI